MILLSEAEVREIERMCKKASRTIETLEIRIQELKAEIRALKEELAKR